MMLCAAEKFKLQSPDEPKPKPVEN